MPAAAESLPPRRRMTAPGPARPKAPAWVSLPAEIRLMILEIIADQKHPGWASLASVCREWQHALEKVNFYKMKLRVSCLSGFERIFSPQKRGMVRHICLNVELPRYVSTCCSERPSPSAKISYIVSNGISDLLSILGTWRPAGDLALEINVYSPSDCEHWFKHALLSSDDVEPDADAMLDAWSAEHRHHDPQHGWIHGPQVQAPPRAAVLRLFRPILLETYKFPQIQAVTSFIIRRQFRRCIYPSSVARLLCSFKRLKHISYEPWRPYESSRELHDRGTHPRLRQVLLPIPCSSCHVRVRPDHPPLMLKDRPFARIANRSSQYPQHINSVRGFFLVVRSVSKAPTPCTLVQLG